jgi:hypothetical protein
MKISQDFTLKHATITSDSATKFQIHNNKCYEIDDAWFSGKRNIVGVLYKHANFLLLFAIYGYDEFDPDVPMSISDHVWQEEIVMRREGDDLSFFGYKDFEGRMSDCQWITGMYQCEDERCVLLPRSELEILAKSGDIVWQQVSFGVIER